MSAVRSGAVSGAHSGRRARRSCLALLLLAALSGLLPPFAAGAGAAASPAATTDEPTVIFLVRHAEKANATDDSPLTPDGSRRAVLLAGMLKDARLTAIFTSAVRRTKETAAPTAASQHLTPAVVATDPAAVRAQVLKPGQRALIVGHSNTVPALIAMLGGPKVAIADDEFDALFILTVPPPAAAGQAAAGQTAAAPTLVTLRYGAASSASAGMR